MVNCDELLDLCLKQSPADSHLVRVAACASLSDLLIRLDISFPTLTLLVGRNIGLQCRVLMLDTAD